MYCFEYLQGRKFNGSLNSCCTAFKKKKKNYQPNLSRECTYELSKDSPPHTPPVGIIMVFDF